MIIHEMIFSMGILEEQQRILYLENTIASRRNFLFKIESMINHELNTLKKSERDAEIIYFLEQMYFESVSYLEIMSSNFINQGIAKIDEHIFLLIEEKFIVSLD